MLDQQIEEQKKRNELEQLKTEQALIQSRGLTKEILYKQFIDKWDGTSPLYGIAPEFLKNNKIIIINPINNQLLPVWLDRLSGIYHASPFFFSLQVEPSTLHTLHGGRYYKESFCSYKNASIVEANE